jgi:EAL domain-containing protein (putative c-di-GMP-specific phosphodiesterase class I)
MQALGLDYVEINLSVAQCLQQDLPAIVARLQARYGVQPSQVNFEITETMFDNLSEVMDRNLQELVRMGYSFSLDDYGIGYSNIHRLSKLPLEIIKIDKSLVDEMFTEDGQVIIRNTVRMMQDIRKELVIEGVETREEMEALEAAVYAACPAIPIGFPCRYYGFAENTEGIVARPFGGGRYQSPLDFRSAKMWD